MIRRCVWVIEVDGEPFETWINRAQAESALRAYRAGSGKARVVRYAPSSKTELNRTKQHARARARKM